MLRRLLLAVFCFIGYYWSENPEPVELDLFRIGEYPGNDRSGELFFALGIAILALSVGLLFILHMQTTLTNQALWIDGLWTARRVRIDLKGIVKVRRVRLKPSLLNYPVYNLFNKGKIRFYTHGNDAVELTAGDGLIYRIGTQRPAELMHQLEKRLTENNQEPVFRV